MCFDSRSLQKSGRSTKIVVSDTQAYRQFGNAVVPAVAKFVASAGWAHAMNNAVVKARVAPVARAAHKAA